MSSFKLHHSTGICSIQVGNDNNERLRMRIKKLAHSGRLFLLVDAQVYALYGKELLSCLKGVARDEIEFIIPSGESSKSDRVLRQIYDFMLSQKISRSDFILAVGGGVTTDLAGYVAATLLRGIRWAAIPTTLLGMVDASIGGKTAINHKRGKNLIGAFWHPEYVHVDIRYLSTLKQRELICGFGEVVKYGGLTGGKMYELLESISSRKDLSQVGLLKKLVESSIKYKSEIVRQDEREGSIRMFLNFGHTFGHGIEKALGYGRLLHGEAVLLGIDAALELSMLVKKGRSSHLHGYRAMVRRYMEWLPRRKIDILKVLEAMTLDKKRSATDQKYILIERPGSPIIATGIDKRKVRSALNKTLSLYCD